MSPEKLSGELQLMCSVILGQIARLSFEKGPGNVFDIETLGAPQSVIDACLRRINAKVGWKAERTSSGIKAARDKGTRRPIF